MSRNVVPKKPFLALKENAGLLSAQLLEASIIRNHRPETAAHLNCQERCRLCGMLSFADVMSRRCALVWRRLVRRIRITVFRSRRGSCMSLFGLSMLLAVLIADLIRRFGLSSGMVDRLLRRGMASFLLPSFALNLPFL